MEKQELIYEFLSEKEIKELQAKGYREEELVQLAKYREEIRQSINKIDFVLELLSWFIPIK